MFRHPKYYKELRKRNKELQAATLDLAGAQSDQAISLINPDGENESVRPGPGLKLGEMDIASSKQQATSNKLQATSVKPQASSAKLLKQQATSVKPCSQRLKLQTKIIKSSDPGSWKKFHGA
jgi:hypothetical protein